MVLMKKTSKKLNSCHKCKKKGINICTAGKDKLVIAPDGRVIPCEAFKFLLNFKNKDIRPNIKDYDLEYLYNNDPLMQLLRCKLNPIDKWCKENCNHFRECGGGCKGQKLREIKEFIIFLENEMELFYKGEN
jgi:radical SAM protein with 4Fe4S-binding SPASM domain